MIKKLTLLSIILSITILSFGQNPRFKNHSGFLNSRTDKVQEFLEEYGMKTRSEYLVLKNSNSRNIPGLKNSQGLKQKLDSLITKEWDSEENQWMTFYEQKYSYDANGNLIEFYISEFDEDMDDQDLQMKSLYTYNNEGNLLEEINYLWNYFDMEEWNPFQKIEYSYDSEGKLIQSMVYFNNILDNEWIIIGESDYIYDSNTYLIQILSSELFEDPNDPLITEKIEFSNDDSGRVLMSEDFYWNDIDSLWIANFKDEYTYNTNGNLANNEFYFWNPDTDQYLAVFKMEYNYDSMDNMIKSLSYTWDEIAGQWIVDWKEECEYDNSYAYADLILPFMISDDPEVSIYFNHKLNEVLGYIWDEELNDWVTDYMGTAHFSEANTSSINVINAPELIIYPNPFEDNISFTNLDNYNQILFELYDSQGRKLLSEKPGSNETIHAENLASGVYFYNLILDGEILKGKIVRR